MHHLISWKKLAFINLKTSISSLQITSQQILIKFSKLDETQRCTFHLTKLNGWLKNYMTHREFRVLGHLKVILMQEVKFSEPPTFILVHIHQFSTFRLMCEAAVNMTYRFDPMKFHDFAYTLPLSPSHSHHALIWSLIVSLYDRY